MNPLLYIVSESDCNSSGRAGLCILIDDLTLKSAMLLCILKSASKSHFDKHSVIGSPVRCKQTIHVGLLFTLQSKSRGGVIDIDFNITFERLNEKIYIFFYCILNYDDNIILI